MEDIRKSWARVFCLITNRFFLIEKIGLFATTVTLSVILAVPASSTPLSADNTTKTLQQIIEKAQKGVPQTLIVEFDHKNITDMINKKRLAAGVMFDREEDTAEKSREYALLREHVFPNGRLGEARVTMKFDNLPLVVVDVPNSQALEKILAHPLVKTVSENTTVPHVTLY